MKIRVIEFITSLGDGGAETLVKDYVRLIDTERFDINVITLFREERSANARCLRDLGRKVCSVYPEANLYIKAFNKLFGRWYVPFRLKSLVGKDAVDVLHVHLGLLRYIQRFCNRNPHMRVFYTCHSLPEVHFAKKKRKERKSAELLLKNNGLQLIALHEDMKEELNALFQVDNTVVIRNGVDFRRFRDVYVDEKLKRVNLGLPEDSFVVGHVGRFTEAKNHSFLIDVFFEIAKKNAKAYLLMVGAGNSGKIEKKLKEYGLSKQYMILSHRQDINEIMRAMDVFVFPSFYEGLPIVLVEAQATGLRCVISDRISTEIIKKKNVVALALENSACWAEVALDANAEGPHCGNLDDYDMNKEIKRLEALYAGEWDG